MLQKLALPLSIVAAEGVDAEVAPHAVAAVRDVEGRVSTARVRAAVHAPLQALGRQEAQVTLTRPVGRPLLGWFLPSRCKEACQVTTSLPGQLREDAGGLAAPTS